MGTRSLTIVRNESGTDILTLYRQMDGYPEGHGLELVDFLLPFRITNGISSYEDKNVANGAGCLAAQIVARLKRGYPKTKHTPARTSVGNFYLEPAGTKDVGEEYVYIVSVDEACSLSIEILDFGWNSLVKGPPAQVREWIISQKEKGGN